MFVLFLRHSNSEMFERFRSSSGFFNTPRSYLMSSSRKLVFSVSHQFQILALCHPVVNLGFVANIGVGLQVGRLLLTEGVYLNQVSS